VAAVVAAVAVVVVVVDDKRKISCHLTSIHDTAQHTKPT